MIKQVSVHEVNELLGSGGECQVIDVREYSEFNSERIADAQLMPLSSFEKHAGEIDRAALSEEAIMRLATGGK